MATITQTTFLTSLRCNKKLIHYNCYFLYSFTKCNKFSKIGFVFQTPTEYQQEYDLRRQNEYSRFHGYTYDGIWAAALAIQNAAHRIKSIRKNNTIIDFKYRDTQWETLFIDALKNTSFEGVTVSKNLLGEYL